MSHDELHNQIAQLNAQIKGLAAQLEASKQMFNEAIQVNHHLRTNIFIFQQDQQQLIQDRTNLLNELSQYQQQAPAQDDNADKPDETQTDAPEERVSHPA